MPSYLTPPIIIEPGAESDGKPPQGHDRSRNNRFLSTITSRSRSRSPRRSAIIPANMALFQCFAGDKYKVEVVKGKRDILKSIGHVDKPYFHGISFGGDSLLPARTELSDSRKNSVIKITNLRTGEEEIGAALLPGSLAGHLSNSTMQCLTPNLLQTQIYVDNKELEPCALVRTTCAFPECPCFAPGKTYRWYWIIVKDEENVLEGRAFVPYHAGPREEIAPLLTIASTIDLPSRNIGPLKDNFGLREEMALLPTRTDTMFSPNNNISPRKDAVSPRKDNADPKKDDFVPKKDNVGPKKDNADPRKNGFGPKKDSISTREEKTPQQTRTGIKSFQAKEETVPLPTRTRIVCFPHR